MEPPDQQRVDLISELIAQLAASRNNYRPLDVEKLTAFIPPGTSAFDDVQNRLTTSYYRTNNIEALIEQEERLEHLRHCIQPVTLQRCRVMRLALERRFADGLLGIELWPHTDDIRSEAERLSLKATMLHYLERYHESLQYYEECRKFQIAGIFDSSIAKTTTNMAMVYIELDNFPKAAELLEEALRKNVEVGDSVAAAYSRHSLALAHLHLGNLETALEHARQALRAHRGLQHPIRLAWNCGNVGRILMLRAIPDLVPSRVLADDPRRPDVDEALAHFEEFERILSGRNRTDLNVLSTYALCLHAIGQDNKAQEFANIVIENRDNAKPRETVYVDLALRILDTINMREQGEHQRGSK